MEKDNYIEKNLKEEKKEKVNKEIINLEEKNNSEGEKEIIKNIPELNFEEDKIEIPQFIIDLQNNEEKFFQKIINKTRKNKEININEFFKKIDKIYKHKYYILTKEKEYKTYLIGKSDNYLVTFNEEKIPLEEIKNIEIIK